MGQLEENKIVPGVDLKVMMRMVVNMGPNFDKCDILSKKILKGVPAELTIECDVVSGKELQNIIDGVKNKFGAVKLIFSDSFIELEEKTGAKILWDFIKAIADMPKS